MGCRSRAKALFEKTMSCVGRRPGAKNLKHASDDLPFWIGHPTCVTTARGTSPTSGTATCSGTAGQYFSTRGGKLHSFRLYNPTATSSTWVLKSSAAPTDSSCRFSSIKRPAEQHPPLHRHEHAHGREVTVRLKMSPACWPHPFVACDRFRGACSGRTRSPPGPCR